MKHLKSYIKFLNESVPADFGAENTTPPVNDDLEDIRFYRGSVAQINDWLNKKLEDQNKTWNPYAEMNYEYPIKRNEKDDSMGYQDYKHGRDSHPENAKVTRRRGSKVDPVKFPSSLDEGWKDEHGYDPEDTTTIDGTNLKNGMSIKQLIKLWKKDIKLEKKIGSSPDGSLVNYYAKESYELATLLHKKYG